MIVYASMRTFTSADDHLVVIEHTDISAPLDNAGFSTALAGYDGDFDWWYGQIGEDSFAYVITLEDELGFIRSADWEELDELLRSRIVAGLR